MNAWHQIVHDLSGKGEFRLILQPAMAIILGIRLGRLDALEGRPPFGWRLFTTKHQRWSLFKQSLSDAMFPLLLAFVLDAILQYLTSHHVRIWQAVVVGTILVWLPFIAARGFTNRIWRRVHHAESYDSPH